MKLTWTTLALSALLLTGCATVPSASAPKPNIRQIFLNYVPPNEPGAPHDMEWIVEHFAGDGGYYGTGHIPGSLTIGSRKTLGRFLYTTTGIQKYALWINLVAWSFSAHPTTNNTLVFAVFPNTTSKPRSPGSLFLKETVAPGYSIAPANQMSWILMQGIGTIPPMQRDPFGGPQP